jgi:hypothetical protein
LQAIQYLEGRVTASSRPAGIVLRYGAFYENDTGILAPATIDQLRRWWSFIHVADAASVTHH